MAFSFVPAPFAPPNPPDGIEQDGAIASVIRNRHGRPLAADEAILAHRRKGEGCWFLALVYFYRGRVVGMPDRNRHVGAGTKRDSDAVTAGAGPRVIGTFPAVTAPLSFNYRFARESQLAG